MKQFLAVGFMLVALGLVQPVAAADLPVMTQNQYFGTDLTPVLNAPTEAAFYAAAVAALQQIAASRPAERIPALAAEILQAGPALVGLQEVDQFTCADLDPPRPDQGCDEPSIRGAFGDHLQATLTALKGAYSATALVTNLNLPGIPLPVNGSWIQVGVVDRDVILARSDVFASPVDFTLYQANGVCLKPSDQGCRYSVVISANTPLGPITAERGFVGVDATVDGKRYRFVNTHLEEKFPTMPPLSLFQSYQAAELIQILQATTPTDRALLLVGDTNSSPEDPRILGDVLTPYEQFVEAGFTDAWTLRPGNIPGLTCCQLADLSNHQPALYERVDMLFSFAPPANVKQARVVGATVSDKTPPPGRGLWPSDHGAVSADLQF